MTFAASAFVTDIHDCGLPASPRKQERTQLGVPLCCANYSRELENRQSRAKFPPTVVLWLFDEVERRLVIALGKDYCKDEPLCIVGASQGQLP